MKQHRKNTKSGRPKRLRRHRAEDDAQRFFAPFDVMENPDWLVGAY